MDRRQLTALTGRFGDLRVGVFGDVVADLYVTGITDRVSREAPIIIVREESQELIPGGAANVARNIASLGAAVELVGVTGRDELGSRLAGQLGEAGLGVSGLIGWDDYRTVTKTRVMAGAKHTAPQQVLRIDREPASGPDGPLERKLLSAARSLDRRIDAWVISDYGYGVVTPGVREWFGKVAASKPVLADSRYRILEYCGLTAIKPNEQEALEASGLHDNSEKGLVEAARRLQRRTRAGSIVMTLGNKGMLVYRGPRSWQFVPAVGTDQIVDLTGAGDTAGAALVTGLAAGADVFQAAMLANCAASVVVMKQGCACCTRAELMAIVERHLSDE